MKNSINSSFWEIIARLILRNRILILITIIGVTLFWANQWKNIRFTFSEANLLPDNFLEKIEGRLAISPLTLLPTVFLALTFSISVGNSA